MCRNESFYLPGVVVAILVLSETVLVVTEVVDSDDIGVSSITYEDN